MTYAMAESKVHSHQKTQPEYSVYIYHHAHNYLEGWNDWEKRTVTKDLNKALDEAESLFATQEFEKVEVKQKVFDSRRNHAVDVTLKIYDVHRKNRLRRMFKKFVASLPGVDA